jgi:hypothetical protein
MTIGSGRHSSNGKRHRRGVLSFETVTPFILPAAVLAVTGYFAWAQQHKATQAWALGGPPCPRVAKGVAFPAEDPSHFTFAFDGITLTRRFGEATCEEVSHGSFLGTASIPKCAFSSPGALAVTNRGRTYYFQTGIGRSATIEVGDGPPRCVVGPGVSVLSQDALSAS